MKIKIQIPEPCHEDWNSMTPNEKGRFCDACNKTVVDFTSYNDQQIINYLKEHENTCGRFQNWQLNRDLSLPKISKNHAPWLRGLAASSLIAAQASSILSQDAIPQDNFSDSTANIKKHETDSIQPFNSIFRFKVLEPVSDTIASLKQIQFLFEDSSNTVFNFELLAPNFDEKKEFHLPKNLNWDNVQIRLLDSADIEQVLHMNHETWISNLNSEQLVLLSHDEVWKYNLLGKTFESTYYLSGGVIYTEEYYYPLITVNTDFSEFEHERMGIKGFTSIQTLSGITVISDDSPSIIQKIIDIKSQNPPPLASAKENVTNHEKPKPKKSKTPFSKLRVFIISTMGLVLIFLGWKTKRRQDEK